MNFPPPIFILILSLLLTGVGQGQEKKAEDAKKKVLVFHKTVGFWHESIPTGYATIEDLGEEKGFEVEVSEDANLFRDEELGQYSLVIFLNTTGDILDQEQERALENFIGSGGSFFGIHAAADTEFDWSWYGKLVGGYFNGHPPVQPARIINNKPGHPTVAHLSQIWTRTDEWYNYKNLHPEMEVLLFLDEDSYEGGENGEEHPIAWYRQLPEGGVAVYTGGGHTISSYLEPGFREHLWRCILFALGEEFAEPGK